MKKMVSFLNAKLTILYGSQTGNAQDLAERIWRESKRFYFQSVVKSMDDYNVLELIEETCVVFVCSTTGQGDEPDNMKQFWRFLLRKTLPSDSLRNLRYAVLGLGDSSYTKFNFVAKRLHKRLQQLGASVVQPLGLGDDQHDLGYDAEADPWIERLWTNLLVIYPLPVHVQPLDRNLTIIPRFNVTSNLNKTNPIRGSIYYSTRKSSDFTATVLENSRITADDHFQDVRLLKLKLDEPRQYSPGDLVVLRPRNLKWQIEEFHDVLKSNGVNIPPESVLQITPSQEIPLPEPLKYELTFSQLCEEYFDLMAIPRRFTFNILAQLTDSELEKEKCLEFTTAEGQNDLYNYTNRPRRNIVEVLKDFPNATKKLTLPMIFELIPAIKPREFSIASSFKYHKNEIHILLAVVKYKTKLVKERFGLCSNFLANLKENDEITAWIKHGSFKFSLDEKSPVIMVGPGTGIAPFRSYILERIAESNSSKNNLILFFGCRNQGKDFLCKNDLLQFSNDGKFNLICAFSRDQEYKIYVQDKILENKDMVWKALNENGSIFVAGNSKQMPQAVRQAFIDVCVQCGNLTEQNANKFLDNLERLNRYQTECWS